MKSFYSIRTILFFNLLICSVYNLSGQISVSPMNTEGFDNAPFQFKGDRVMMGDRIDTELTKNIFLFTKASTGTTPDMLFPQQFQKNDDTWTLAKDTIITSDETIILWGNRKGFFDKDGQPVAFFTYSTGDPSSNVRSAVYMIAFYSGGIYTLTEYPGQNAIPSKNFLELPNDITIKLFDFWNKLDKWKKD